MIPKRSPELNLGISKGSPSVNPPSTIRCIQRAASGDPLSVLVSIWGWDGVPKRVTDPKIRIARKLQTEQGSGWKLTGCHQEDWT